LGTITGPLASFGHWVRTGRRGCAHTLRKRDQSPSVWRRASPGHLASGL